MFKSTNVSECINSDGNSKEEVNNHPQLKTDVAYSLIKVFFQQKSRKINDGV
jgi:hypothetical protein